MTFGYYRVHIVWLDDTKPMVFIPCAHRRMIVTLRWSQRIHGVVVRADAARRRYDTFIGNTDRGVGPVDQDGINGLLQGKQVSVIRYVV